MNHFAQGSTGDDQPYEGGVGEHTDNQNLAAENSATNPSMIKPSTNRARHEADVRSRRSRRAEAHPTPDGAHHRDEEIWELDEEMKPGLAMPKERWLAELEQTKRRDRYNLTILLVLIGYLTTCGVVAAWLLVKGVDQQTVNMFLQVFVVSLIPVIILVARGFHR
ncbi:hypothetical protein ACQPZX_27540 [Actinoplanes sp. CA-142083]|uniref:hypothetical protein n=1 Tax=Actinoplanes sp. CA-142083 TaxID=3239903 RepID=UPI003D8AEEEF